MSSSSPVKKLTLRCRDGASFQVDDSVARQMTILVPEVKSHMLEKVIEYCNKHPEPAEPKDRATSDEELKAWDAEFMRLDPPTLLELSQAAHHLKVKGLMDLASKALEEFIKGKTPEVYLSALYANTDRFGQRGRRF